MAKAKPFTPLWTPEELAWLTGLYEGEGCLSLNNHKWRLWVLAITMTDEDVLAKASEISTVGSFFGPISSPSATKRGFKPQWRWVVAAQEHIKIITDAMYPMLGDRRRAKVDEFRLDYEAKRAAELVCPKGHIKEGAGVRCIPCSRQSVIDSRRKQSKL